MARRRYPTVTKRQLQRSEGPYWTLRYTLDGRRREMVASLDGVEGYLTEDQAEEARAMLEARLRVGLEAQGPASPPRPVDVVDCLILYGEQLERRRGMTEYVRGEVAKAARCAAWFGSPAPTVQRLRTHDLEELALHLATLPGARDGSTMARETIFAHLRLVRRAIMVARKLGRHDADPPAMPPKKLLQDDARPLRDLAESELRQLVAAAAASWDDGFDRFVTFAAWAPRRPKAIVALDVHDARRLLEPGLPRAQRQIFFQEDKGGVGRGWGPLTEPALRAATDQLQWRLDQGAAPDAPLWVNSLGDRMTTRTAWTRLNALTTPAPTIRPEVQQVARADVDHVTLYDLRRHGVGRLLRRTRNLRTVMRFTGHESVQTLMRYMSSAQLEADELAVRVDWTQPALQLVEGEEG